MQTPAKSSLSLAGGSAREVKMPQAAPLAPQPGDIDIRPLLLKLKQRWYVMAISVVVALFLAFLYVKTSPNIFAAHTTILLEDQSSGSKRAEELLEMLEIKDKGIKVEDEIGLIKSYNIVQRTMERLDFAVSYFEAESNVFNKFTEMQIRERYKDNPYRIIPNPAADQMCGTRIDVKPLSATQVEISVEGKDVRVFNLSSREMIIKLPEVKMKKVITIGEPYQDKYLNFKLVMNDGLAFRPGSHYYFKINDLTSLTNDYLGRIEVKPIERESRILDIRSEGAIIEKEIKFLNTLVDVLVEFDLSEKNETGLKTLNFLEGQLSKIGDSLRNSETSLSSFRSQNKMLDVNDATNSIYQKLDALENEKARYEVQLKYYQNVLNQLETQETVTDVLSPSTMGIENPILNSLLIELITLNRQLAGLATQATKDAPNVRTLQSKIDNAKSNVLENLQNNMSASRISLKEVSRRIVDLEGNIFRLPENERRLQDLQGKTNFNAKTYNFFLEKRAEAQVSLAANAADKRRVDEAKMVGTGPLYPKSKQIYIIAFLLGLVIPAGLIIFIDKLDNTIRSKEELTSLSAIPFLGIVTDAGKVRRLPVIEKPLSAIAESFRSLRINLQYLAAGMDKKVIGVTSSISGEGKTFCSANIAAELAHSGKKVALIEVDLRRPTVSRYFDINTQVGLTSYLIKAATLDQALQETEVPNLRVMPCGPIPPNPVELLSMPAMGELIEKLRKDYDYVVLDIPPIGFVSEYFVLLDYIDANLFVTRYKYTSRELLGNINSLYQEGKIPHLYLVLNGLNYYEKYEYRNKGEKYYRA